MPSDATTPDLLSLFPEELEAILQKAGEPKYRAGQIFPQLHRGLSPEEMTNIGKATRDVLAAAAPYRPLSVIRKLVSALDGTVKYLFALYDGECVESVVMRYEHGLTICISSQVGCRMGCRFCASTLGGKVRDLSAGELLGQVVTAQRDLGERISNIVLMGIGEPLDNYDQVVRFIRLVSHPDGLNIGCRHISLSTCGLADRIDRLAKEGLPITLSISLHAPDDTIRDSLMPVNRRFPIHTLLESCNRYFHETGRRISFEYTLIAGQNDTEEVALKLADVLNRHLRSETETMPIHVNLIPVNTVKESGFARSGNAEIQRFARTLEAHGIRATVRRTLGADINASCGQLRRAHLSQEDPST